MKSQTTTLQIYSRFKDKKHQKTIHAVLQCVSKVMQKANSAIGSAQRGQKLEKNGMDRELRMEKNHTVVKTTVPTVVFL